jgi:hypothetical protein
VGRGHPPSKDHLRISRCPTRPSTPDPHATPNLPFGGAWTFDIAPDANGSNLRITEDGEVYNVIFRFMARYIFGHHASIETYLKDLGAKFHQEVQWDKN